MSTNAGFTEAGNHSVERAPEKGSAKPQTDSFSAYRMPGPPEASASKPNVVENDQLIFSPIFSGASTGASTETVTPKPGATPDTSVAQTGSVSLDTPSMAQTQSQPPADALGRSPGMIAAITDQGQLDDPGQAPMWMYMAPMELQGLIQQNYGESALNGFQPGVKVPGVDEPAVNAYSDGATTAQNGQDTSDNGQYTSTADAG